MEKYPSLHLTCFALALSVIFFGSTIYYGYREALYEQYAENIHEQSLSQLLNSLDQLDTSLKKAKYLPEGAMRQTLAANVWKESQTATAALAALPLGDQRLEQIETYIAQVGDYAYYLMRSTAYDRDDKTEWETFCGLHENAKLFLADVDLLKAQVDTGAAAFRRIDDDAKTGAQVDQTLEKVNEEFPQYASLIYDGPYSDHVFQRKPKALAELRNYSVEQAMEKAAALLQLSPAQLQMDHVSEGQIPAYGFSSGTVSCAISKQGGFALALTDTRGLGQATLAAEQAVELAKKFLDTIGLTELVPSYHTIYETICTINFVSKEQDITAYPDLVKVGVALDDGAIVRLDAAGYAMNHHDRQHTEPKITLEEARNQVPDSLQIQSENLAYIPTTGYHEVLCWEFVCRTAEDLHALLYINCENGQAENLLLLIESENGTLTR